ncbi:MAG TPA: hypothetical protein VK735_45765 [Pseudonocardia sp.]|uniref:hypothetical protein n=1 Tax=Pseudonocardia sp. TaxID=60912 RepID=UPI002B7F003F|nr:hypothetical protein [Pseudonocardia sp.]HTF54797.1 hypothetical protein [Pseudonocardia sp.]
MAAGDRRRKLRRRGAHQTPRIPTEMRRDAAVGLLDRLIEGPASTAELAEEKGLSQGQVRSLAQREINQELAKERGQPVGYDPKLGKRVAPQTKEEHLVIKLRSFHQLHKRTNTVILSQIDPGEVLFPDQTYEDGVIAQTLRLSAQIYRMADDDMRAREKATAERLERETNGSAGTTD